MMTFLQISIVLVVLGVANGTVDLGWNRQDELPIVNMQSEGRSRTYIDYGRG